MGSKLYVIFYSPDYTVTASISKRELSGLYRLIAHLGLKLHLSTSMSGRGILSRIYGTQLATPVGQATKQVPQLIQF